MTIQRFQWNKKLDTSVHGGALTIGNFDGVHRGHQALLDELRQQARLAGGPAVVLTFDPHPLQLLRPQHFPPLLTTMDDRAALLQTHGADIVLIAETNAELLNLSAREFFNHVIDTNIQPHTVVPGFNFGFGKGREGTVDILADFCRAAGRQCILVPPTLFKDETISSSRVRATLQAGNVALATELLGRHYTITGRVILGEKRGRTIGFPTANLDDIGTMLPAGGVYAVQVRADDATFAGAANIGANPTFGEEKRKVEVHLLDFAGDLYEQSLHVTFVERLRETTKFSNVDDLVKQLQTDVQHVRELLG